MHLLDINNAQTDLLTIDGICHGNFQQLFEAQTVHFLVEIQDIVPMYPHANKSRTLVTRITPFL